jgi:prepilin-type N-terminal cleavage/methylation domain-containing protein
MRKGFTLLEIIVVIVILGIMATLAATQYTKMVEKSRGAEARTILGSVRTNQAANRLQNQACSSVLGDAGVGVDFPSTCSTSFYFSYGMTATGTSNLFTATAARCSAGGKNPNGPAGIITVSLVTNFDNGWDSWVLPAPY